MAPSALGRAPTDQTMSSSATPSEKEIRILIADDHPIVCQGLIAVFALEDDLKVVGHAGDGEEACLLCKQLCPDILILDLRMPKKDGIEVVIELTSQKPAPGIIVLTHSAKEEDLWLSGFRATSYFDFASKLSTTRLPCGTDRSSIVWAVTSCPQKQTRVSAPLRDRKLASFNAQLTDARLVCRGRPGGFAMDGGRPIPSPLCGPVTGQPQVTVLRITIPSHTALHLAVTRNLRLRPGKTLQ